jgi:hypothetical protein
MKSIKEWREIAENTLDESLSHHKYKEEETKINTAKRQIKSYDEFVLLLKPDVLKRFKIAMGKLKNRPNLTLICLEGDLENVHAQYEGKWCVDNKGEISDEDVDSLRHTWCSEHDGQLRDAFDIIDEICEISEFHEIVKILKKIAG